MAEKAKPPLPEPTGKGTKKAASTAAAASTKSLQPRPKYLLPLPVRTFPLPTFYPTNPASLVHLAFAWLRQIISPPPAEPAVVYNGVWSPETRSVHVTDPKAMDELWCQGFFGKGSLSRSEPTWIHRQRSETSELRTAKRREERADTKWERGRTELEAIEQRRLEEEALAASKERAAAAIEVATPPPSEIPDTTPVKVNGIKPNGHVAQPVFRAPVGPRELLALPNAEPGVSQPLSQAPVGSPELLALPKPAADYVSPPTFKAPVGPVELLALPNSEADLLALVSELPTEPDLQANSAAPVFRAPVGPLELLALPNSEVDLRLTLAAKGPVNGVSHAAKDLASVPLPAEPALPATEAEEKLHINGVKPVTKTVTEPNHVNGITPLEDMIINGIGDQFNGAEPKHEPFPGTLFKAKQNGVNGINGINGINGTNGTNGVPANGRDENIQPMKRRKSVRFSPKVESTTFQHSDPPSPNHSSNVSSRRSSNACLVNGKTSSPPHANGTAKPSPLSQETSATKEDSPAEMVNREHLQLSAEEALFLAYGVGALTVTDPETKKPLATEQLFNLFRQYSYFPPRTVGELSPDDPFLVHYVVYHHFRSLGWVPRHGIKFGVDWLLYAKGPALDHAEFGVVVIPSYTDPRWKDHDHKPPRKTWQWLHSVIRVLSTVYKSMVIVYVDIPPPGVAGSSSSENGASNITDFLGRFKIREVVVRRWSNNRNRD